MPQETVKTTITDPDETRIYELSFRKKLNSINDDEKLELDQLLKGQALERRRKIGVGE